MTELVRGPWTLKQLHRGEVGAAKNGLKVFSTFSCGGGSTMGYKLAGYEMVGCCEIDDEMLEVYRQNHRPRHAFHMGIQDFNKIPVADLHPDLHALDILDGSPPCSVFSTAGRREENWGIEKQFREGQALQRLDDLFLHFLETARRLRPRVVVAENVKGMLKGNARGYVKEILTEFGKAGYDVQLFLFNASRMGVPQARERVFFIGRRADLGLAKPDMEFGEEPISFGEATADLTTDDESLFLKPTTKLYRHWHKTVPYDNFERAAGGTCFTFYRLSMTKPARTVTGATSNLHPRFPRFLSPAETTRIQTFPDDFDYRPSQAQYVCGMSVPPLMMQRIALRLRSILLPPPCR